MIIRLIVILMFVIITCFANTFEKNGIKKGNSRISIGLLQEKNIIQSKESIIKLDFTYGKFLTDKNEISLQIHDSTDFRNHSYKIDVSYNYYFFKNPTFTPYVGFETGVTGDTFNDKLNNEYGISIGVHKFFTENLAVTIETGIDFIDIKSLSEQYTNINLTYFFD